MVCPNPDRTVQFNRNTEPLKAKYELAGLPRSVLTHAAEIKAV